MQEWNHLLLASVAGIGKVVEGLLQEHIIELEQEKMYDFVLNIYSFLMDVGEPVSRDNVQKVTQTVINYSVTYQVDFEKAAKTVLVTWKVQYSR